MLIGTQDHLGDGDAGKLDVAPRVRFGQVHLRHTFHGAMGNDDMICTFGPKSQIRETNSVSFKPTYACKLDAASVVKDSVMNKTGVGKGPFAPR